MEAHKSIIIGTESLRAFQAKLRAIDRIPEAQAAKAATVIDAQKTSDNVLKAIAILGGLLKDIEPVYVPSSKGSHNEGWKGSKQQVCSLPSGITHKESHQAQTIAGAPVLVERTQERARDEGRFVTPHEVYREIKKMEREERYKQLMATPWPSGKFRVIYADPPWKYRDSLVEGYA